MERFKNIVATFKRSLNDFLDKVNLVKQIKELRDQVTDLKAQLEAVNQNEVTAEDVADRIEMCEIAENLDINYRQLASWVEIDYSELAEEFEDIAGEVANRIETSDIADNFSSREIAEHINVDYSELAGEVDIENVAKEVLKLLIKNYQKQPQV